MKLYLKTLFAVKLVTFSFLIIAEAASAQLIPPTRNDSTVSTQSGITEATVGSNGVLRQAGDSLRVDKKTKGNRPTPQTPFRLLLGAGYSEALFYSMEMGWEINDAALIGFRFDGDWKKVFPPGSSFPTPPSSGSQGGSISYQSITLNMIFYDKNLSTKSKTGFFFGGGLGLYTLQVYENYAGYSNPIGNNQAFFGLYPKIGVELGRFVLSLDYNFIFGTAKSIYGGATSSYGQWSMVNEYSSVNYLTARAGFYFGGMQGKQKIKP
jgi:hypothetical protein